MASPKIIPGSERSAPAAKLVGQVDPGEQAEVSIYLRRPEDDGSVAAPADHGELGRTRQASLAPTMAKVAAFAESHGLKVSHQDAARRLVKLSGSLADLQAAFGTQLQLFEHPDGQF